MCFDVENECIKKNSFKNVTKGFFLRSWTQKEFSFWEFFMDVDF